MEQHLQPVRGTFFGGQSNTNPANKSILLLLQLLGMHKILVIRLELTVGSAVSNATRGLVGGGLDPVRNR